MADERVVAVTGASRGLGAAIAQELARRGFRVGALTRRGKGVEESLDTSLADRFVNVVCDVTDEESVKRAFRDLVEQTGRLDGLVNNAGIHLAARSSELATNVFDAVMGTNARALFVACRETYPYLAERGGTIVNLGSFFDKLGVKWNVPYCASKAAVGAITRCLAVEWAPRNIRVLDVAPGYVETELNAEAMHGPLGEYLAKRIPGGAPASPEAIARIVASLFSEDVAFLTGETIYVDGGQGIAH
jgi:NAD(P)-dependent dehydrogenase (short-subunit alcohol dehydrogenase family)